MARELRYSTHNIRVEGGDNEEDDGGGAGVREPRRPLPVVGPQQAEHPHQDDADPPA